MDVEKEYFNCIFGCDPFSKEFGDAIKYILKNWDHEKENFTQFRERGHFEGNHTFKQVHLEKDDEGNIVNIHTTKSFDGVDIIFKMEGEL